MPKMIQIRHVPDELHRQLIERARDRGVTLTSYIEDILAREVARPPADEIVDRIAGRAKVDLLQTAADILREERKRGAGG